MLVVEKLFMGDVQGPEKVNDACMKTVCVGTVDRGFIYIHKVEIF
jgi:hypothetical protein